MADTYRILFIGAGFSRSAGLPLGYELFEAVRKVNIEKYGTDNRLERDLKLFIEYLKKCEGRKENSQTVDYEEFLGFLDIEHFLGLRGSDTWSSDGNESQLMIKTAIARVLYERTPDEPPSEYRYFARSLNAGDIIFTFNYDTLLEKALEAEDIPYRLFPNRFSEIHDQFSTIDTSVEEVTLLKLHGSIDWFARTTYDEITHAIQQTSPNHQPKNPVFGPDKIVTSEPLTSGPRPKNDPLTDVVKVEDISPLLERGFWECPPLILSPSRTKILYFQPFKDFWYGLQESGGLNLSLGVIGYSLPSYDDYARQALYHVFQNYTGYEPDLELFGHQKTKIRIIDYRPDSESEADLRARYRFADWSRTELRLDGFSKDSAEWLFR